MTDQVVRLDVLVLTLGERMPFLHFMPPTDIQGCHGDQRAIYTIILFLILKGIHVHHGKSGEHGNSGRKQKLPDISHL